MSRRIQRLAGSPNRVGSVVRNATTSATRPLRMARTSRSSADGRSSLGVVFRNLSLRATEPGSRNANIANLRIIVLGTRRAPRAPNRFPPTGRGPFKHSPRRYEQRLCAVLRYGRSPLDRPAKLEALDLALPRTLVSRLRNTSHNENGAPLRNAGVPRHLTVPRGHVLPLQQCEVSANLRPAARYRNP